MTDQPTKPNRRHRDPDKRPTFTYGAMPHMPQTPINKQRKRRGKRRLSLIPMAQPVRQDDGRHA